MNVDFTVNPSATVAAATWEASLLNNEALSMARAGNNAGAERLHKQALEIKIDAFGADSIQAALTFNALGEVQYQLKKYDEAEENLRKAVQVRNGAGPAFDAAVSRENLAQVFEAKERFLEAKQMRDKGKPNNLACGYDQVSWPCLSLSLNPRSMASVPRTTLFCEPNEAVR